MRASPVGTGREVPSAERTDALPRPKQPCPTHGDASSQTEDMRPCGEKPDIGGGTHHFYVFTQQ
eukprot:205557-Prymnesium_polylepis.1